MPMISRLAQQLAHLHVRGPLGLLLLAMLGSLSLPQTATAQQNASVSIAVVDVDRLFEESSVAKAASEEIQAYQARTQQKLSEMQQQLRQIQQSLQQLSPESEQFKTLRQDAVMLNAQAQALQQSAGTEIGQMIRMGNIRVLRAVKEAVARVAQQKQIGLVIRKSPPLPENANPADENAMRDIERQMAQQIALYAAPSVDITSDVLLAMDETFRNGGAATTEPSGGNN